MNVLEQAQTAAKDENWSLLTQYLQEIVTCLTATRKVEGKSNSKSLEDEELEEILALALEILEKGDFQDRWEIVKLIPQLGSSAIAPLTEIVQDEEADLEQRWFAIRILGEFNQPEAIAPLLELLKTCEHEELCTQAANTLANLGFAAIDALTTLLTIETSRPFATAALAQIRRPEIIEPLLSVVGDSLPETRATALEALNSFHDPRIVPVLLEAVTDSAAAVRKEAAIGLGIRPYLNNQVDLVNLLKPLLWDIRWEVCQQSAIALSRLKTDNAAEALFEILRSQGAPNTLKIEAVRALGWMETATALEYLQQAFTEASEPQLPILTEIATVLGRVEQPDLKAKAAEVLIDFQGTSSFFRDGLRPAESDRIFKQTVVTALGQLRDPRAIATLIQLLGDSDTSVRLHCEVALKQFDPEKIREQLQQCLANNPSPELQQGIAIALQELINN